MSKPKAEEAELKASYKKTRTRLEFESEKYAARNVFMKQASKRFSSQIITSSDEIERGMCSNSDFCQKMAESRIKFKNRQRIYLLEAPKQFPQGRSFRGIMK
jgi:hypothetical protein